VDTFERLMSHSLVTRFLSEDWARGTLDFKHCLCSGQDAMNAWLLPPA
jgi:hypothetical protein